MQSRPAGVIQLSAAHSRRPFRHSRCLARLIVPVETATPHKRSRAGSFGYADAAANECGHITCEIILSPRLPWRNNTWLGSRTPPPTVETGCQRWR